MSKTEQTGKPWSISDKVKQKISFFVVLAVLVTIASFGLGVILYNIDEGFKYSVDNWLLSSGETVEYAEDFGYPSVVEELVEFGDSGRNPDDHPLAKSVDAQLAKDFPSGGYNIIAFVQWEDMLYVQVNTPSLNARPKVMVYQYNYTQQGTWVYGGIYCMGFCN